jgi:hypothetical protein
MNATEQPPIGRVLDELARSRGYSGLNELADAVAEQTGKDYSVEELSDWPQPGYGKDVDRVLHLTDEERMLLVRAWKERLYQ